MDGGRVGVMDQDLPTEEATLPERESRKPSARSNLFKGLAILKFLPIEFHGYTLVGLKRQTMNFLAKGWNQRHKDH